MSRKLMVVILLVSVTVFTLPQMSCAQMHRLEKGTSKKNLYDMLSDAKEVKVYLEPVTDATDGHAEGMTKALHDALREEAKNRISINFAVVKDPHDADLVISCRVQERIWMEVDPVDEVYGIGAVAKDIAIKENYGRIEAYFTVSRGPNKQLFKRIKGLKRFRKMWSDEVKATITKADMPEEMSKKILVKELAHNFIVKAFGKRAKMEHNKPDPRFDNV